MSTEARNEESPTYRASGFQKVLTEITGSSFSQQTASVNGLLVASLRELREFLKYTNEERRRKEFARRLDDIDRRRWGYPSLRTRERRSRYDS